MDSIAPLRTSREQLAGGSGRGASSSSHRRDSHGNGGVSGNWSGMNSTGGGSSGRLPAGPYARPADNSLGGPSSTVKASSTTSEFTKRKNWSQHIIDEIQDFMHVLSPDGKIIFATPSIRDLTGWSVEEVTNRPIADFIHTDDIEGFARDYETSLREGKDLTLYYRFRMKDDRYTIFEITGHPYYAEENGQRKCKCFFGMGRPYPSKNTAMLDSFLELKIENERLRQELQVMYQDIEGNGGMDYGPAGDYARERTQNFANSYELDSARFDSNNQRNAYSPDEGYNNMSGANGFAPVVRPDHGTDKRKKAKGKADDGEFVCRDCGTVDSPEWRKGPEGPKSLCNACGLRYAKLKSKDQKLQKTKQ